MKSSKLNTIDVNIGYKEKYGFSQPDSHVFKSSRGLNKRIVEEISYQKREPFWMRDFRLRSYEIFLSKTQPSWGADLSRIDYDNMYYYVKPTDKMATSWKDLPPEILDTYKKIGIPEAEEKYLGGVGAQYDSEMIYHSLQKQWEDKGVIFTDTDTALKKYPEFFTQYFGKAIPAADNKLAALNSAVWSGGSFIYVPKGVKVGIPLQAYFRINEANMGQFERTLIIADEGSEIHYVEGCSAPVYTTDSLHAAVVEIFVKKGARCRYTTIQNWSKNVYNLVTKRAFVEEDGYMEWIDGNLGCLTENAKVFTNPGGPVSIKDLKPGDYIYGVDLNSLGPTKQRVKGVIDSGMKETFRLTTTNFREVEASSNHPFLVLEHEPLSRRMGLVWKRLDQLRVGDWLSIVSGLPDEGKPYVLEADYEKKGLKNLPTIPVQTNEDLMWLLGLYLGDGFIDRSSNGTPRRIYFAIPPKDRAREKLEKKINEVFNLTGVPKGISLTINSTILAKLIMNIGFDGTSKKKRIPSWLFGLPKKQKLAFIEGYLDSDGYISKPKIVKGVQFGQIVFASNNKDLLEDLRLLMISCGLDPLKISTYVKERRLWKGRLKEYICHYLNLNVRGNLEKIRQKELLEDQIKFVQVKAIEPIGKKHVYDIEVEGIHNFIANGIVVHNSQITMKYPSIFLKGRGARGEILSVAFAGSGQHQDVGGKAIHLASDTSSSIVSKSVSKDGGRSSYRGLLKVIKGAKNVKANVRCDALILDDQSRSDTYPTMDIKEKQVAVTHEATVSKIGEDQLFYLMSRGLSEADAATMVVNGFIEPIVKELPLEYALELNRLIQLEMIGSVG